MKPLPLLSEHPRSVQILLAVVVPALYGALTGYLLGVSEPAYTALALIGIVGALGAGFDHVGAKAGAARGVVAGSVFGASILIVHEIHGASAKAHLPEPAIVLVAVTTTLAIAFAALGGWLRERVVRREEAASEGPAASEEPAATEEPAAAGAPATQDSTVEAEPAGEDDGRVGLNSGSFEDFRGLGMSVTQAKRVISYREELGGYSSVDDLDRVPGFPAVFLAELKRQLRP
ncbi:MAG TPA: helix-hairpin-helix domain-containing protein [Solirubrobacterales bacterium]|nr:helix-hairpin-helix domain-containing protein [Solirubrobacterales bacterium]